MLNFVIYSHHPTTVRTGISRCISMVCFERLLMPQKAMALKILAHEIRKTRVNILDWIRLCKISYFQIYSQIFLVPGARSHKFFISHIFIVNQRSPHVYVIAFSPNVTSWKLTQSFASTSLDVTACITLHNQLRLFTITQKFSSECHVSPVVAGGHLGSPDARPHRCEEHEPAAAAQGHKAARTSAGHQGSETVIIITQPADFFLGFWCKVS